MGDPNLELWRERYEELSRPARELREVLKERRFGEWSGQSAEREIEVRWGLPEDEHEIGELLELNGMLRPLAFEERFIVAEMKGEVLAGSAFSFRPNRPAL